MSKSTNTVVGTQMTNLGVRHGYKDLGIDFIETDVGVFYLKLCCLQGLML
jgi:phosphomannomutase